MKSYEDINILIQVKLSWLKNFLGKNRFYLKKNMSLKIRSFFSKNKLLLETKKYFFSFSFFFLIQGVHKVRVHFKKFITLFLFVIEIICKNG